MVARQRKNAGGIKRAALLKIVRADLLPGQFLNSDQNGWKLLDNFSCIYNYFLNMGYNWLLMGSALTTREGCQDGL
jgi:hypothetical protein